MRIDCIGAAAFLALSLVAAPLAAQTPKPLAPTAPAETAPELPAEGELIEGMPSRPNPAAPPPAPTDRPGGTILDVLTGRALFHGRYCGLGKAGEPGEPIDVLDAACRDHDTCYELSGGPVCACDRELRRQATAIAEAPQTPAPLKEKARTIATAARLMTCVGP